MQIEYLDTAASGLEWFVQYYRKNSQLDAKAAVASFDATVLTLSEHPFSGQRFEDRDGVFEKKIVRTPFSVLYTVRNDTLFVIDVRDQRGKRSGPAIKNFVFELQTKLKVP